MKILLIKGANLTPGNSAITYPLGLMHIAASARAQFPDYEFLIKDLRLPGESVDTIVRAALEFKPDVVGLSGLTVEAGSLYQLAKAIRTAGITSPIAVGGPHASSFPEEVLQDPNVTMLARGEGEQTFIRLLEAVSGGGKWQDVPGLAFKKDGAIVVNPQMPFQSDLDGMPVPAWDLVDIDAYSSQPSMAPNRTGRFMNLFTSRACPYRCIYCHSIFGKGFRAQTPERVLSEIEYLHETHGIKMFEILDDIFNWDLDRAKKIFDLLHERGLHVELAFPNGLRCDRIDREFLVKLKRLGMAHISVAVESASPRLQKFLRKNLNLERIAETINTCDELGIFTRGFFMLGFPTETEEEMKMTVDYACKSRLHSALFFTVIPFKGTQLYDLCKDKLEGKEFGFGDHDYFTCPINVSDVPDRVFFRLQKKALLRFYFSPRRIIRILRVFPNKSSIFKTALPLLLFRLMRSGRGNRKPMEVGCSTASK